jgi:hypothetical protein
MSRNKNILEAKKNKNDEFYTQYNDIEKELQHYKKHLNNKIVYCNCDKEESNFVKFFRNNFEELKLKDLLISNGLDFRSSESIELLKQSDIVVTNPPFSLFREYVAQLIEYEKKFLIIGSMNAITYKEVFPLIKDNKIWLGVNNNQSFVFESPYENDLPANKKFCIQKGYIGDNFIKVPGINWYTNLEHKKRNEEIILFRTYEGNEENYPKYDNYDAINIDKVKDIPMDYDGVMGVPITFLDKYNPNQFEIIGGYNYSYDYSGNMWNGKINGKYVYKRILIAKR